MPDFFLIGAPKCGTTSLAQWLACHPDVYFSPVKEPHFFNADASNRKITTWNAYASLFSGIQARHRAVGEGSVWYLYSDVAVPRILDMCPHARFIVMLREPLAMLRSLYIQQLWAGNENARTVEEAWLLQRARRARKSVPLLCANPDQLQYGRVCSLGWQVERLLGQVNRDNVHFVLLRELVADQQCALSKVCDFLGIATAESAALPKSNRAGVPRSFAVRAVTKALNHGFRMARMPVAGMRLLEPVNEWNKRAAPIVTYSAKFRTELVDYFREDAVLLERHLGSRVAGWVS